MPPKPANWQAAGCMSPPICKRVLKKWWHGWHGGMETGVRGIFGGLSMYCDHATKKGLLAWGCFHATKATKNSKLYKPSGKIACVGGDSFCGSFSV